MKKSDCINERISNRVIGVLLLPAALFIAFIGALMVPVAGLFFSVPLFLLSITLIAAPDSKACKLLTSRIR